MRSRRASGLVGAARKIGRQVMTVEGFEVFTGFFNDHVGDEDAVDAGLLRGSTEVFESEAEDGIVVGEDDQAGCGTPGAKGGGESEYVAEAGAIFDGAFAGALDDGAVGKWIAEGDAELEDVGARVNGGDRDVVGGRDVGVADGEVGDEAGFAGEPDRHRRSGSG